MTIFGSIVHSGAGPDENVLHVCQFRDFGFCCCVAAQFLEQQLFDVAQAQLEPKIPAHRATDNDRREAVAMIKRFRFLHRITLRDGSGNVTKPG
jgi:hypothetical protein